MTVLGAVVDHGKWRCGARGWVRARQRTPAWRRRANPRGEPSFSEGQTSARHGRGGGRDRRMAALAGDPTGRPPLYLAFSDSFFFDPR